MDFSKLAQIQLSSETEIKPFKCAEDDLNGFLFDDAKHFQNELMAVTSEIFLKKYLKFA